MAKGNLQKDQLASHKDTVTEGDVTQSRGIRATTNDDIRRAKLREFEQEETLEPSVHLFDEKQSGMTTVKSLQVAAAMS